MERLTKLTQEELATRKRHRGVEMGVVREGIAEDSAERKAAALGDIRAIGDVREMSSRKYKAVKAEMLRLMRIR